MDAKAVLYSQGAPYFLLLFLHWNDLKNKIAFFSSILLLKKIAIQIFSSKLVITYLKNISFRIEISPIKMMDDKATRCRFVSSLPNHEEVLVTSMSMNKIYIINLTTDTTQTLGPFREPNEADRLEGLIYILIFLINWNHIFQILWKSRRHILVTFYTIYLWNS